MTHNFAWQARLRGPHFVLRNPAWHLNAHRSSPMTDRIRDGFHALSLTRSGHEFMARLSLSILFAARGWRHDYEMPIVEPAHQNPFFLVFRADPQDLRDQMARQ